MKTMNVLKSNIKKCIQAKARIQFGRKRRIGELVEGCSRITSNQILGCSRSSLTEMAILPK